MAIGFLCSRDVMELMSREKSSSYYSHTVVSHTVEAVSWCAFSVSVTMLLIQPSKSDKISLLFVSSDRDEQVDQDMICTGFLLHIPQSLWLWVINNSTMAAYQKWLNTILNVFNIYDCVLYFVYTKKALWVFIKLWNNM